MNRRIRICLLIGIMICLQHLHAQSNLKIVTAKENGATVFYASSSEYCPVSLEITLTLDNMQSNGFSNGIFVVPAFAQQFRLFSLAGQRARKPTTYSYTYRAVLGDVKQVWYDSSFRYDLPFKKNAKYRIEQGYNGRFTHQNENSLDFNLPEGTQVRAARAGVVVSVVQSFKGSCLREDCKAMANHILIYHNDGTLAEYSHLSFNSARVAVGDSVNRGDLIALSGNTGYTRGPHLHFICYLAGFSSNRSIKTRFRVGNGQNAVFLEENKSYSKVY